MIFDILTVLPDFFKSSLDSGVIGRAVRAGTITVRAHDIREYATDTHRTVDDAPYGGGAGMVLKPEPIAAALRAVIKGGPVLKDGGKNGSKERVSDDNSGEESPNGPPVVILVTPQGRPLTQAITRSLAEQKRIVLLCGRYEGIDERVRSMVDMEISIGDYILTGGEAAALVIVDAVGRLVPGVLGSSASAETDSFSDGLLEGPQYTRPESFEGASVPDVLLSGNHKEIERWRRFESLKRTFERRPDLLEGLELSRDERAIIEELKRGRDGS